VAQLSVLIAGCGDLGNAIAERLSAAGLRVYGMRRNIDQLSTSVVPIEYDLLNGDAPPKLPQVDYLLYTAAAKSRDLDTYQKIYVDGPLKILAALPQPPKRVILTSSTGVYAQNQHQWIDEESEAIPSNPFGKRLLQGELALAAALPAVTRVRLSGIYGPGRMHLLNRVRVGEVAPMEPLHYSNRIHRDDAAGFITHLVQMDARGEMLEPVYLASDDAPSPIGEITHWLAQRMGVEIQSEVPIQRGGSKRCRNTRLRATGYELIYPDYRRGFAELL
jgi:nucleoside-diphosphate-sugar epimerase